MGIDLPLPRSKLPRVSVTQQECAARKAQMDRILAQTLHEYDQYRADNSSLNPQQWKVVASKERVKLYREVHARAGVSSTLPRPKTMDDFEDLEFKYKLRSLRLIGNIGGLVENAVFSVICKTQEEYEVVMTFLHDDLGDCSLVNVLEEPTEEQPLHYLAYKWFIKKAPGGGRIIRNRDMLYLEYTGMTTCRTGERVGFILNESVDISTFPGLPELKNVRAFCSLQLLLVQRSDYVVEMFMTMVVEPSIKIIRPMPADAIFNSTRVVDLAESRRLTTMMVQQRLLRKAVRQENRTTQPIVCTLCLQPCKMFSSKTLVDCNVCGRVVCTKCTVPKRIFVRSGSQVRTQRAGCCKQCIIEANSVSLVHGGDLYANIVSAGSRSSGSSGTMSLAPSDYSFDASEYHYPLSRRTHGVSMSSVDDVDREYDRHWACEYDVDDAYSDAIVPVGGAIDRGGAAVHPRRRRDSISRHHTSPPDLYSRMLELCRVAEDTYHTTRQNHWFVDLEVEAEQQRRP